MSDFSPYSYFSMLFYVIIIVDRRYVFKKHECPNDRLYLSIVGDYRDAVTKKTKQRKVITLEYLDDLYDLYDSEK